jgi:hypothetical protein
MVEDIDHFEAMVRLLTERDVFCFLLLQNNGRAQTINDGAP